MWVKICHHLLRIDLNLDRNLKLIYRKVKLDEVCSRLNLMMLSSVKLLYVLITFERLIPDPL